MCVCVDRCGAGKLIVPYCSLFVHTPLTNNIYTHTYVSLFFSSSSFWDSLFNESVAAAAATGEEPTWLMGRVFVSDITGLAMSRFFRARPVPKLMKPYMDDHFPEGLRVAFVVNAPWIFSTVWKAVKGILPAATVKKVRIYKKGQNYLDDLQEFVALDQIPRFLGGTSPREWPYGEGGDLPKGEGAAIRSGSEERPQ